MTARRKTAVSQMATWRTRTKRRKASEDVFTESSPVITLLLRLNLFAPPYF